VPSVQQDLRGQVILITGGASGIGAAGAAELQRRGAVPVLVDQDAAGLAAQADSLAAAGGTRPLTLQADITSLAECEAAVQAALARHGRLDIVWANAGMAAFGPLAHTDPAAWRRCIDVNVNGTFHTVRAALPAVQAARGYVCLTASVSTFAHPPMMSAYAASKAAVEAMADAWRIELAAHGVDVGIIHASWVRTPLVEEGELHPGFIRLRQTVPAPMRRALSPEDAAKRIVDGMERRRSRIWVPGWVRALHWLRALLHLPQAERALRQAAPELEQMYLEIMATEGAAASSYAPRELQRAMARRQGQESADVHISAGQPTADVASHTVTAQSPPA
jgi:NAD(P)-dependent dehydrogenase (short-subunit alcohol dehydrogenase family)